MLKFFHFSLSQILAAQLDIQSLSSFWQDNTLKGNVWETHFGFLGLRPQNCNQILGCSLMWLLKWMVSLS